MKWYRPVAWFFSGAFLTNAVPHFVNGISGNPFPSPFSNPPGKGLSSPLTNVLWGLLNIVIGYVLFKAGKMNDKSKAALLVFFAGVVAMGVMLSIAFADKAKL